MKERDRGLQPERTSFAWRRTTLSMALNAILFLRAGLQEAHVGLLVTGISLCAGAAVVARVSTMRQAELRGGFTVLPEWLMAVVAALAAGAAVISVISIGMP